MHIYQIGNKKYEVDEGMADVNNKARLYLEGSIVEVTSHYRAPDVADASVSGEQKSNLYTKLSVFDREKTTTLPSSRPSIITYNTKYSLSNSKSFNDLELLYYAIYLKKDVTPGTLIKICKTATKLRNPSYFFKVRK